MKYVCFVLQGKKLSMSSSKGSMVRLFVLKSPHTATQMVAETSTSPETETTPSKSYRVNALVLTEESHVSCKN